MAGEIFALVVGKMLITQKNAPDTSISKCNTLDSFFQLNLISFLFKFVFILFAVYFVQNLGCG